MEVLVEEADETEGMGVCLGQLCLKLPSFHPCCYMLRFERIVSVLLWLD